jgi:hypothetical protein
MQYAITDHAAIELARTFYEALADGLQVDAAMAEARKAVSLAVANSLEWGTPVLYLRAREAVLFRLRPPGGSGAPQGTSLQPPSDQKLVDQNVNTVETGGAVVGTINVESGAVLNIGGQQPAGPPIEAPASAPPQRVTPKWTGAAEPAKVTTPPPVTAPPPSEITLTLAPGVTMTLLRIPVGKFLMGSYRKKDK